jgi:hypothetical protein
MNKIRWRQKTGITDLTFGKWNVQTMLQQGKTMEIADGQDTAISKKMYGKLYATRRRRRPKTRWLDDVSTDLRRMGINEWRDRTRDREAWRLIVMEAKAHPRL